MKKILFVLFAGILMSSCMSRCDEDETRFWGQYEYNRQYYEHYSDDIMEEVARNSIFTLDYVLRLKETLNVPLTGGTYVIVDTNGVKAGPLVNIAQNFQYQAGRQCLESDEDRR